VPSINFCLQSKGGIGKSFCSAVLAERFISRPGSNVLCVDTDPTTPTFSAYDAFKARHINIMTPDMNIEKGRFDELVDMILDHDGDCVADNGASSFLPIMSYMLENNVIEYLLEAGKQVYVHAPLVAGSGQEECLRGLDTILTSQPAPVVVWENAFLFGPIEKNGKRFNESILYNNHKDRIAGIVHLPHYTSQYFLTDFHTMTSNHLTFEQALASPLFKMTMQKQRLTKARREIFEQLDQLAL
jgi:hypothetical protein